jgi:hypothetical protein
MWETPRFMTPTDRPSPDVVVIPDLEPDEEVLYAIRRQAFSELAALSLRDTHRRHGGDSAITAWSTPHRKRR